MNDIKKYLKILNEGNAQERGYPPGDIRRHLPHDNTPAVFRKSSNTGKATESTNHLGDREYQTWGAWRKAALAAGADRIDRKDEDGIAYAWKDGRQIGNWGMDTEFGTIYNNEQRNETTGSRHGFGEADDPGISKKDETEFHRKLDTLVHDTFGKRADESKSDNFTESLRREWSEYMSETSHKSPNRELWDRVRSKGTVPPIDRDRYTDLSNQGLEGPFRQKNGQVLYYDPREGKYYNRDTDMYISHDDFRAMNEADITEGDPDIPLSQHIAMKERDRLRDQEFLRRREAEMRKKAADQAVKSFYKRQPVEEYGAVNPPSSQAPQTTNNTTSSQQSSQPQTGQQTSTSTTTQNQPNTDDTMQKLAKALENPTAANEIKKILQKISI